MSEADKTYLTLAQDILENGNHKEDRTGTGTLSTFGRTMRFDLSKEFPILTTKEVHFKSVVTELLFFLRGDTNIKFLQEHKCRIWDAWASPSGDIGNLYPATWRKWYAPSNQMIEVPIKTDTYIDFVYPYNEVFHPPIECDLNTDTCWAIEDLGAASGNTRYRVQLQSGFITELARPNWRSSVDINNLDGYKRSVFGVGFLGEYKVWDERIHALWYNMMARCYNKSHPNYKWYGLVGVRVSPIWHSYEKFSETINAITGYTYWQAGADLQLDKDYYGSGVYSPDTCIFLPASHNVGTRVDGSAIEIRGEQYASFLDWAYGDSGVSWYANSRWRQGLAYKGILAEDVRVVKPSEGMLWRKRVFHDQVAELILDIKNNPDSRRLLVLAWNPADLPNECWSPLENVKAGKPALGACHYSFQCYVTDGKLSLMFNMRSNDFFLGNPFNIASYALLTHMLAQVCGLGVGELIWNGGDCHIYKNHIEQMQEQIQRYVDGKEHKAPVLELNPNIMDIDDFTHDDIKLLGYKFEPAIKAPVAV